MCTFESEHSVVVCDLAIGQVCEMVSAAFGDWSSIHLCQSKVHGL
jgi:hypothetical protein